MNQAPAQRDGASIVISDSEHVVRSVVAPLFVLAGLILCFTKTDLTEDGLAWGAVGITLLVMGLLIAPNKYQHIDLEKRELIEVRRFAMLERGRSETPLDDFSKIVVHLVCHPGGEGEDTFTGSVGLKPKDGKAIVWVKSFPATREEMPMEADEFARQLAGKIGLRYQPRSPE